MRVELVTIGDELMLGFTVDTNAAHIARELSAVGVEVAWRTTVGDAPRDIALAVEAALDRTGAVITTGGLGPTADDMTRETVANLFGRRLVLDPNRFAELRRRWEERRVPGPFPESNAVQAMIPEGADVLANAHGTAPGLWMEDAGGRWIAMLPGVPREMRGMLAAELIPRLRVRGAGESVIRSLTLRTTGVPESSLSEQIGDSARGIEPISLAYLPGTDGVDLRLTVKDVSEAQANPMLESAAAKLRDRIGRYIYAEGNSGIAAAVIELCRAQGKTIAVAESCTGGLLGARLTEVAGAGLAFLGGVIAYDNRLKREQLGVAAADLEAHGAVSEEVASAMARGVKDRLGASISAAITGIAGPAGGTPEKPVGTVCIAVEGDRSAARTFRMVGDRAEIRERSAQAALSMMRVMLLSD